MKNKLTIVKAEPRALSRVRSTWLDYQQSRWPLRVIVPVGLGGVAAALLNGAWQVLGQGEYLAAMLLTLFCLVVGIGAALAITIRTVKYIALVVVVLAAAYSISIFLKAKGNKPWSIWFKTTEETTKVGPHPTPQPSVTPAPVVSPAPAPSSTPTPTTRRKQKPPCDAEGRLLGQC